MDLELGLKITKTRDDIASISEYRLAKDRAGPVFESRETNTMFILSAHLKGYKKNSINIKISEDGRKITISGEKPIQEILMMGWMMHKKEIEVTSFNKIFKIPDGVNLDRIKAKYDDEEWILNIFMPKLVKGICGARIEEVKEEQISDRGKSEIEKREADHILSSAGETSQKGSKKSGVKATEDSESSMEKKKGISDKKLEDVNKGIRTETIQKEEESKLGIGDGNGESVREKVGKEGDEIMKTSELEQSVGVEISQKIGDTSQKEKEESKLRIEDGKVKRKRKEVGKVAYEGVKKYEIEVRGFDEFEINRSVGVGIQQNIGDTSQDEEFEVQGKKDSGGFVEKGKMVSGKMSDATDGNIIGVVIQKEMEESKSGGIEDRDGESVKEKNGKEEYEVKKISELEENVGAHITQVIGDTNQGVSKELVIKQMEREDSGKMLAKANESSEEEKPGESKQKPLKPETEDTLTESMKESSMELKETMNALELDQNVADHIPSNVGGTNQEEFNKSRIEQKGKIEIIEEKMDEGKSEGMPLETSKDSQNNIFRDSIQKAIKKPKIETGDGDQDSVGGKAGMKGFDAMRTIREEFPEQLPKATIEGSEGPSVVTMQETEDVKEAMAKRKGKDIEYFVDKGDGEEPRTMLVEAKKDLTKETMQETEDVSMVKRKGKEIEYFGNKGEGEDPKRMHMEAKEDVTMQETEDVKKATVKGKGMEIQISVDKGEGEEPERVHMGAKEDLTKETVQETEEVKEAIVKRKGKEIDTFVDKGGSEEPKRMHKDEEDMTKETMQEEVKNGNKDSDQQNLGEKTVKGRFDKPKSITEELPKQAQEQDGSKVFKVAMAETESLTEKVEGEESKKRIEQTGRIIEKNTKTETLQKETEELNIEKKARDAAYVPDNMVRGVFDVSGTVQAKLPKQGVDAIAQDKKDKKEFVTVKFKGEGSINMHVEPSEAFGEDTTGNRIEEEIGRPKLKPGDKIIGKENVGIEVLDGSKRTKFPEMGQTKDVKKEGAKIQEFVKKENGDKYEMTQVEAKGGLRKEITGESTWKEREGPKILTKEKDQQFLQETSKARVEASKAAKEEFPAKIVDSKGLKETKVDEAEELKEELVKQKSEKKKIKDIEEGAEIEQVVKKIKGEAGKRKIEETNVVESATKGKIQEPESEKFVHTLQESADKHQEVVEKGSPERESQYTKGRTTHEKVVSRGFKEVEQGRAKEKTQKTEMLPPKIQSKETHESKSESENQDILRPRKAKEVKGKQTEVAKQIATMEDQVAKPLSEPSFPSTPQSEVEEKDKLYKGGKVKSEAFLESQREYPTKDMKNLIGMKETQESKQTETLKPKPPLQEHQKRGAQVNKKDEFHKGHKYGETMQEETEGLKDKIDDRDQQFMQRDLGKGVGKVDTSGKEMLKREYVAESGPIAERAKTKRDMEATPERDKYITSQKVKDEKSRIQEENINVDIEKGDKAKYLVESMETVQDKEHPMELGVEKEAESSLPSVTSMGVEEVRLPKNEIEEIQKEDLSPQTAEMKSKDPLELEKPITKWKVPKTKAYVAEPRDSKQYGYGKEDLKESLDEEDRRSVNVIQTPETSKGFQEKEKVDGQEVNQEETKREHRAEVLIDKREGPKVTKNEETKEASRQQLKREREKPAQTKEDEKPKVKETTPELKKASEFEQVDKEEKSPKPVAFPRKEPHELSWSSKDYKIPKIEEVQQEKEGERPNYALETTASEEQELTQATATDLKAKSDVELKDEIDKPHVNQPPPPSKEMLSKEPCEFNKLSPKEDDSKAKDSVQMQERKELIVSTEDTSTSEAVADEVAETSKLSSSSKDKTEASHEVEKQEFQGSEKDSEIDDQEPTKGKTDQEVEERETLQPESPADQQYANKDHEESQGIHEIEEEKAYKQDEFCEDSQELEEQKESKEEGPGGKKDDTKRSKKLFVSSIIAGSAVVASGVFIFIRHRRTRKGKS